MFPSLLVALLLAFPPDVPNDVQIIREGDQYVLRTFEGAKPLYTYDRDGAGKSNCIDSCAAAWPPLKVGGTARPIGKWSIIDRTDGSKQWAFGGKPVYTFAKDEGSKASGDGLGGVWHLLPSTPAR